MELNNNHVDESICHYSTNEEVDLQPADEEEEEEDEEQESKNNSLGGRWYECVFCKRGFNTAQALGGHMNIHRKDRAKNNPTHPSVSSSSSTMANSCYNDYEHHRETFTGPRVYPPILHGGYPSSPQPPPLLISPNLGGIEIGYPMYFPDQYRNNNNNNNCEGLCPYVGDDRSVKLSLQLGSSSAAGMIQDYNMERIGGRSRDHKELDLELRLGPHP